MKLLDFLNRDAIVIDLKATDKMGVLEELAQAVARIADVDQRELVQVLMERERLGSTGIGHGIAIPHGKMKDLSTMVLGFGVSKKGVAFESLDNRPAYLFFLLITPLNSTGLHLKMLAQITSILKNEDLRSRLMKAADPKEVLDIIKEEDTDF